MSQKHQNYEILNLIGYGLAKFDMAFVRAFGFKSKMAFYQAMVSSEVAETVGTVKNRQDLFDPFFPNPRKGWWQKGDAYIHRKHHIDILFGHLSVDDYVNTVKLYLHQEFDVVSEVSIDPLTQTKFRKLQETGLEAELYFMQHYNKHDAFANGRIEDARLFGDGYDFQIYANGYFFLAEVKGLRTAYGGIRLTQKEFLQAKQYKTTYSLVVVSNLEATPKMDVIFDPCNQFTLTPQTTTYERVTYHIPGQKW